MIEHPPTPRLCEHARQRCAEMGISTKVAKRIVTDPVRMLYPGYPGHREGRMVAWSPQHPQYLVVTNEDGTEVVTVLWKSGERLTREQANDLARQLLSEQEAC